MKQLIDWNGNPCSLPKFIFQVIVGFVGSIVGIYGLMFILLML